MTDMLQPTPLKMNNAMSAVDMAWQYVKEVRDNYMCEKEDSDNLEKFTSYLGVVLIVKTREVRQADDYFITGVDGSAVNLSSIAGAGGTMISKQNKIEAMEGIAQFFYALVKIFKDEAQHKKNSLSHFMKWGSGYVQNYQKTLTNT